MVVLTERIPKEILNMSELEFSEFFNELLLHIENQKWSHLTKKLVEDFEEQILDLTRSLEVSDDEERALRDELSIKEKSIQHFKNELESLLNKL
jgi:hypothetical protein